MNKKLLFMTAILFSSQLFAANDARRIFMLEHAIAPKNPQMAAHFWAEAAKNRNGAVQYMLLCPAQQKNNLTTLEKLNWVTGVSSPNISNYEISPTAGKNQQTKFNVRYYIAVQDKIVGTVTDQLQIQKAEKNSSQQWCISEFKFLSPSSQRPH